MLPARALLILAWNTIGNVSVILLCSFYGLTFSKGYCGNVLKAGSESTIDGACSMNCKGNILQMVRKARFAGVKLTGY
jgi:hypothetical protein